MSLLSYTLTPSLPASSWDALYELWSAFHGTLPEIQIDIVDGVFAPYTSWPFNDNAGIEALRRVEAFGGTSIEIDAMCVRPEQYLDLLRDIDATRVVIHAGSTKAYDECLLHRKDHGYTMGLGILNTTPKAFIHEWVPQFDYVQVMGIASIGVQGQPFDERTIETVRLLRDTYPQVEIAVDGAVNSETIPHLLEAGANRFAPGSAISKSENPAETYKQLYALLPE